MEANFIMVLDGGENRNFVAMVVFFRALIVSGCRRFMFGKSNMHYRQIVLMQLGKLMCDLLMVLYRC